MLHEKTGVLFHVFMRDQQIYKRKTLMGKCRHRENIIWTIIINSSGWPNFTLVLYAIDCSDCNNINQQNFKSRTVVISSNS